MWKITKRCEHCGNEYAATSGKAQFCSDRCHLLHNVRPDGDCLLWIGTPDKDGYGTVKLRGRRVRKTHRAFYEEFVGPIPDGVMVCHSCDNPPCVKPEHLFLGTALDNKTDSVVKARHAYGERAHKAKLTETQALEILASDEPAPVLAERYGIHRNSIYYLRKGKSWKHLQPSANTA